MVAVNPKVSSVLSAGVPLSDRVRAEDAMATEPFSAVNSKEASSMAW